MQTHPAQEILANIKSTYPRLFTDIERYRNEHAEQIPAYCYCPSAAAYGHVMFSLYPGKTGIECVTAMINDKDLQRKESAQVLAETAAIISTWRMGQGIYRFDETLAKALIDTPTDKIPGDILLHLPEWCIYVETPWNDRSEGFFAMLDDDYGPFIRIFFLRHKNFPSLYPVSLSAKTLDEAMEMRLQSARELVEMAGKNAEIYSKFGRDGGELLPHLPECISLLLYICSIEPDYRGSERPSNPSPVKTRRGERIFPALSPRVWEIGYNIGEKLREAATIKGNHNMTEERNAPRPHLRRAHWHTYRVGKERQGYRIRWVHPILIGFNNRNVGENEN